MPGLKPALLSRGALCFATSMGAFGTAFTLGTNLSVLPLTIYGEFTNYANFATAAALTVALGVPAAWGLLKAPPRLARRIEECLMLPGLATALGIILLYGGVHGLRDSWLFILIGHVLFTLLFMIRPVLAGAFMVLTLSVEEFNITWMLYTPLTKTLPVGLADSYASMRLEVGSAYTLIFIAMILPLLLNACNHWLARQATRNAVKELA
ncbi:ABC transporter permease [Candidatus Pantoea persica]|uniref:ABC transporter permease n=1 Tax=Candidatus Pantoea persica TaxID=2518128 RepID=UPI00215DBE32|nr:hypothetical protein [Candidatus Pantoea persica]MBA2817144.1 ABC transporter permease [Candidatus Pantoea persica]